MFKRILNLLPSFESNDYFMKSPFSLSKETTGEHVRMDTGESDVENRKNIITAQTLQFCLLPVIEQSHPVQGL
jgi:hypothetical protein